MEINPSDIESTVAVFTGNVCKGSDERLYALFYRLKDGTCKTRDGGNGADVALQLLPHIALMRSQYKQNIGDAELLIQTVDVLKEIPQEVPDDARTANLKKIALEKVEFLKSKAPIMKADLVLLDESEANLKEILRTGFSANPVEAVTTSAKSMFQSMLGSFRPSQDNPSNQAGKPLL